MVVSNFDAAESDGRRPEAAVAPNRRCADRAGVSAALTSLGGSGGDGATTAVSRQVDKGESGG